jgi:hypothetical protein
MSVDYTTVQISDSNTTKRVIVVTYHGMVAWDPIEWLKKYGNSSFDMMIIECASDHKNQGLPLNLRKLLIDIILIKTLRFIILHKRQNLTQKQKVYNSNNAIVEDFV